jgi:hypothetical protein
MSGKVKKTKKFVDVHISKSRLMQLMIFNNDEERERCSKYLDLKGVAYHVVLINHILRRNRAFLYEKGKIKYKVVSDIYKYDKRLRNRLYKFLSAFEEQIRGFIANSYNHGLESLKLNEEIIKNIEEGSNIAVELENLDFGELVKIVSKLSKKDLKRMFPKSDNYAISHHRILLIHKKFKACYIDGKKKQGLANYIKNLVNLIDEFYKQFLIDSINDAINDKRDPTFSIPKNLIIKV